ncbi:LOW QUALITY PROTEIN: SLC38A5 isoform 11 [Pan troglodytes]|uniref:SLC38A5 isoform 11 n=1 Tax=Pan troglodytes TaxID=9598 RepID=A0A2J8IQT5_PANTR|nr:LOW QUALITY PROTEIN: SLC38A5 isoform 11 [Pan troglodytes]
MLGPCPVTCSSSNLSSPWLSAPSCTWTPRGDWFLKGNLLIIIVSVLIILPLALMKHLGYLGYTSGLSLTCMLFFLVSVIYKKFQLGCAIGRNETAMESEALVGLPSQGLNSSCEAQMFTVDSQMSYTVPIMAFAFVCHPEVLPIYTELCRPSKRRMQAVANVSIGAMFCMYGLTATFGYLTFYSSVKAEMLHMYSQKDPLILCVRLAVLLAVTLTVPVVLFPIRRALQQLLFPGKAFSWPRHVAIALILLVLVNVLVICVPTIRDIFGVIGSTSAPSLIFILPSIFYLRIVPSEVEPFLSWPKIQALCFGVLGVLFMAVSLGFMFANWATGRAACLDTDQALLAQVPVRMHMEGSGPLPRVPPAQHVEVAGSHERGYQRRGTAEAADWPTSLLPRDAKLGSWP